MRKYIVGMEPRLQETFQNYLFGKEFPSFEEMVDREISLLGRNQRCPFGVVARGFYMNQVTLYLKYFTRSHFHFVESALLRNQRDTVYEEILRFLGISHSAISLSGLEDWHTGSYAEEMSPSIRARLAQLYAPHNEELFRFLNVRYPWAGIRSEANQGAPTCQDSNETPL